MIAERMLAVAKSNKISRVGVSFYSFGRIALTKGVPRKRARDPLSFYCSVNAADRFGRLTSMVVPFSELASTSTVPP